MEQVVDKVAELQNLAAEVLNKMKGLADVEVNINFSCGYEVEVRQGEVTTLEYNQDKNLSVSIYQDQRSGSAATADLSPKALMNTIEAARTIATYTQPDPYNGLPDKEQLAYTYPDCDLYHPWSLTPQEAIELCQKSEAAALAVDPKITTTEGVSLNTYESWSILANNLGFNGIVQKTRHSFTCVPLAQLGEQKERDYEYTVARSPLDLIDPILIAQQAAHKVLQRLGARQIPSCRVPVLLTPAMARGFLKHFISAISGSNLYREASFLTHSLGKEIFPQWFSLTENPHLLKGLASAPFDGEGVATKPHLVVENGVLTSYVLDSYTARKLNLTTTGNAGGIHNCKINSEQTSFDALLKKMHRGLLVTELMGQGVNLVTGDYSRGAAGFWIENGVIQYPVNEITIAGSLADLFKRIVAIGDDLDGRGAIHTGSLLIEEMSIGGC